MIKKLFLSSLSLILMMLSADAQVVINEYSTANLATIEDEFMKHEDWIELYNPSDNTVNLSGHYLSDNPDNPKKWVFPNNTTLKSKGYYVIWCDGRDTSRFTGSAQRSLHTNFKFTQTKKKAETIVYSDANGIKIDEIKIAKMRPNQSRGRQTDGAKDWVIFNIATPRAKNTGFFYTSNAEKPVFSVTPGVYTTTQNVTIATQEPDASIYYTTDGSEPTAKSKKYTTPVSLDKTTVLKAVSISNTATVQASLIEFATYFINDKHTMPVISIACGMELDSLAQGNQTLRPFGSFEYFDAQGTRTASSYGEYNSHGQDSWVNNQRSLDFISRDECGYNSAIKEKLLPNSERDEYQRIIMRAAGDDNYPDGSETIGGGAHMRDAYLQNLVNRGGMNLDVRSAAKAILYVNGYYWGVYDIRDRPNDHDFTEFKYGQGKYDLQYLQTWGDTWAEYGGDRALQDWEKFTTYVEKNNATDPAVYKKITDQLDVTSLTDYLITNSVSVCSDWLNYNVGWWRGKNPAGQHQKWGFQLWDNDATFGYYVNYTGIPDTSAKGAKPCDIEILKDSVDIYIEPFIAKDTVNFGGQVFLPGDTIFAGGFFKEFPDVNKHMMVFDKLMKNNNFRQYYLTRYTDLIHTVFSKQNMLSYFDSVYQQIKPEMPRHIQKWGGTMTEWENNVSKLRHYIAQRCDYLSGAMKSCYELTGPYDVTFDVKGTTKAAIGINSQTISAAAMPYTTKLYGGIPNVISGTTSDAALQFGSWTSAQNSFIDNDKNANAQLQLTKNEQITANFVKAIISTEDIKTLPQIATAKVYPTVFTAQLTVEYELPQDAQVHVTLYDLAGKIVAQANEFTPQHSAGKYTMRLDFGAQSLSDGLYLVEFQADKFRQTFKVIKQ